MRNIYATIRRVLTLVLPLATLGCEHPGMSSQPMEPEQKMLSTDSLGYAAGAPVTVRLSNTTSRPLGYNLCQSSLERRRDGDWETVQPMLAEACTAELRTLRPGQSVTFSFRLNPQSRRGSYRIRTELDDLRARTRFAVVSSPFAFSRSSD